MGKVEFGKMQLENMEFRMADVLEESMDLANAVGMSRGIEVIWDPCDFSVLRCATIIGDCKRFKKIIDMLLGNAIKFTPEGHVMLRAWANRPIASRSMISPWSRLKQSLHAPSGRAFGVFKRLLRRRENCTKPNSRMSLENDSDWIEFYFEVVDTGVGIPKEKWEFVFDNYVQVKEGHDGTGLRLGLVQSFVRLMGGEVSIKDKEPGEVGTCFGFNVFMKVSERPNIEEDIQRGKPLPSPLSREPAACFKGGQCVLLVHGHETRRILHTWMESVGMRVWTVPCAELLAPILEKARSAACSSPSRTASMWSLHGDGSSCFSFKEMVNHLRKSSGMAENHGRPLYLFGILVIVDVSAGMVQEVAREAASLARVKQEVPCRVVCLTNDLETSSEDLSRFNEAASIDLNLRKPIHGSRLYKLLQVIRDLQANPFALQPPYQFGTAMKELRAADQISGVAAACEITRASEESEIVPAMAAPAPQGLSNVEECKPLEGMRMLLVDDSLLLQRIHKQVRTNLGATVETANDGSLAVAMFTKALEQVNGDSESRVDTVAMRYDVIFMDCQMPVMNGYDATRSIREEESRYGIHTLIISLSAEEGLQEAIESGMDLHLTKPIPRRHIVGIVLDLLNQVNN